MGLDISVYEPTLEKDYDYFQNSFLFKLFPDFIQDEEVLYYDMKTISKMYGYNVCSLDIISEGSNEVNNYITIINLDNKKEKTIINPPIISKTEPVIFCKEIGYQRKGANSLFYEETDTEDYIFNLVSLKEFHIRYFNETFSNFKENIILKFIEGKNFVYYSY